MRTKRAKTIKKDIQQLRTSFNFREPYQVIVDGNFLSACTTTKKDPYAAIHDILFGEIKLMTTYCVCVELRALGTDFVEIADEAKRMEKRRCTHTTPVSASECIKSIIGTENKFNYFVATQDQVLREELRMVPGTPLIYENRSIVNLEPLSRPTRLMIDEKERIKNLPLAHEKSLVVKKERTKEKKSKKRKIKEPNSLSIKKKKVKVDEQPGVVDDIKLGTSIE